MVKREAELTRQFNEHMKGGTGTVEVIRQENTDKLDPEALGKADFFICVPKDMTSTF